MLYLDHACKEVTKIYMLLFYFSGTKLPAGNNKTNSKISSVLFTIGRVSINALVFSDFFLFRNLPVTFYFINKKLRQKNEATACIISVDEAMFEYYRVR